MTPAPAPAAAAKSLQSCPTLCDPIDSSPPGSPVPGILQARTLEWVAFPSPMHESKKVKVKSLCRVRLLATPWTAAHQAPLSMGFSRKGVPLPSPMPAPRPPKKLNMPIPSLFLLNGHSPHKRIFVLSLLFQGGGEQQEPP